MSANLESEPKDKDNDVPITIRDRPSHSMEAVFLPTAAFMSRQATDTGKIFDSKHPSLEIGSHVGSSGVVSDITHDEITGYKLTPGAARIKTMKRADGSSHVSPNNSHGVSHGVDTAAGPGHGHSDRAGSAQGEAQTRKKVKYKVKKVNKLLLKFDDISLEAGFRAERLIEGKARKNDKRFRIMIGYMCVQILIVNVMSLFRPDRRIVDFRPAWLIAHIVLNALVICLLFLASLDGVHQWILRHYDQYHCLFLCVCGSSWIAIAYGIEISDFEADTADGLWPAVALLSLTIVNNHFVQMTFVYRTLPLILCGLVYVILGNVYVNRYDTEVKFWDVLATINVIMLLVMSSNAVYNTELQLRRDFARVMASDIENDGLKQEQAQLRLDLFDMLLDKMGYSPETDENDWVVTPLDNAIMCLRHIRADPELPKHLSDAVTDAVVYLGSGNLFSPDLEGMFKQGTITDEAVLDADREMYQWISGIVNANITSEGKVLDARNTTAQPKVSKSSLLRMKSKYNVNLHDLMKENAQDFDAKSQVAGMSKELLAEEERIVMKLLLHTEDWDFDCFQVAAHSYGHPLLFLSMALLKKTGLMTTCNIEARTLRNFMGVIERGYKSDNPYHNSIHAADVMRTVHFFITVNRLNAKITPLQQLALLVSAAIHDFEHPGVNNNFLIATQDRKALLYNDRSVLENHHLAAACRLLTIKDNDIFQNFSKPDQKQVRKLMVELVLATDLSQHFGLVGQFKSLLLSYDVDAPVDKKTLDAQNLLVMKMALKTADIGHTGKTLEQHKMWSELITEEFFLQGDKERQLGLPVSPFMDREDSNVPNSQVGFIDFLAMPLFDAFAGVFNDTPVSQNSTEMQCKENQPFLVNIKRNRQYWANLQAPKVKEEVERRRASRSNTAQRKSSNMMSSPRMRARLTSTSSRSSKKISQLSV